jgi:hypothetical protein
MKTRIITILAAIAAMFLTIACQEIKPEGIILAQGPTPAVEHVYTVAELFPEGDAIPFLIVPRDGWVVSYGEVILFKALLLDEATGIYQDVTNSDKCQFDFSYGSGKSVNGSDPSMYNGREITVRAVWNKTWGASTTGTYQEDPELERPIDE